MSDIERLAEIEARAAELMTHFGPDDMGKGGGYVDDLVARICDDDVPRLMARLRELEAQAARPEIALFARLMEIRMARHDGDWGDTWKLTPVPDVLEQIEYALGELRVARLGNSTLRMAEKAADVANFAMMAAFAMSDVGAVVAALAAREE